MRCADLLARGDRVARGGVGGRREEKADAEFANGAPGLSQRQINANAQRFQNIGGAAARADGAIAMLGDMRACGSSDERGCRRNIECAATVATGAAGVHHVRRAVVFRSKNRRGVAAHDAGKRAKFAELIGATVQGQKQAHNFRRVRCGRKAVLP